MKKWLGLMVSLMLMMVLAAGAAAEETAAPSALDAFFALTGKQAQVNDPAVSNDGYLKDIMNGVYMTPPADEAAASLLAQELNTLADISSRDIASYASQNGLSVTQVRNAYYRSLANVLQADIQSNPAAEERQRNTQIILDLFLDKTDISEETRTTRQAIRDSLTSEHAGSIAADYQLPQEFVEFVIMDDGWNDDLWDNDDDWKEKSGWSDPYDDSASYIGIGDRDTRDSTSIADMQEQLIALGYLGSKADGRFGVQTEAALVQFQRANGLPATGVFGDDDNARLRSADAVARWDYQDSFDSSPDMTPDNSVPGSVDVNSPDHTGNNAPANSGNNSPNASPDNSPVKSSPKTVSGGGRSYSGGGGGNSGNSGGGNSGGSGGGSGS